MKLKHYLLVIAAFMFVMSLGVPLLTLIGAQDRGAVLNEEVELPFKTDENKSLILLYFGYVGCIDVCPPSINEIHMIYGKLDDKYKKKVDVYFVNIIEQGNANRYAKYFDEEFKGITLSPSETLKFMDKLHAYKSDALTNNGEIYHTSYLYLLKRINKNKFILRKLYYTSPYGVDTVINDIKKELK